MMAFRDATLPSLSFAQACAASLWTVGFSTCTIRAHLPSRTVMGMPWQSWASASSTAILIR